MMKLQSEGYKSDEPFYTQVWFWVIVMIIVICCSVGKKTKVVICGNGNGSGFGNPLGNKDGLE